MKPLKVALIVLVIGIVACAAYYAYTHNSGNASSNSVENFGETLGLKAYERHYYEKCVDDCARDSTLNFMETGSTTQLLCQEKCSKTTEARIGPLNKFMDRIVSTPDGIEETLRIKELDIPAKDFQRHRECTHANGQDIEKCYCEKEVEKWCAVDRCLLTKSTKGEQAFEKCKQDCIDINLNKCTSGLSWSWKP